MYHCTNIRYLNFNNTPGLILIRVKYSKQKSAGYPGLKPKYVRHTFKSYSSDFQKRSKNLTQKTSEKKTIKKQY